MAITFTCESCEARFSVADRLAGKKARCKGCGRTLTIPSAPASRPMETAAAPALAGAAVGPGARPLAWLNAVTSQVALKPITMDKLQALGRTAPKKPSMFEEDENTPAGPYDLLSTPHLPAVDAALASGGRAAPRVVQDYRNGMLHVQRLFRMLNEWAFVASAPFLAILLLAIAARSYSWAVLGATVVVLLNLSRLATGLMNLVVIPFRDNPVQGVLFLVPPFTVVYCVQNWKRVRKPVERVLGPALTIGLVVAAFAFLPFLNGGKKTEGSVTERLKAGASSLETKIQGKLGDPDLGRLKGDAQGALDKVQGALNPAGGGAAPEQPEAPK